jgi:hypothetical protein
MDKTHSVLDQLVAHAFVPHVLLVTTPGVDEACLKNGPSCRFLSLLQPLCHFENACMYLLLQCLSGIER